MARVAVIVSLDDAAIDRVGEVVAMLERAGLEVRDVQDAIGIVSGAADASLLPALRRLRGIAAVEIERQHQLPPPDSDLQ